jgi:hypothetical protein
MPWIDNRLNNSNSNNNKTLKNTSVSNPYKNNIFPSLRPKTTFTGVNPMAWASSKVLQRQKAFRTQKKGNTAILNAKRNRSLTTYKSTRRNRRR